MQPFGGQSSRIVPGSVLAGKFRIESQIGKGGAGAVYGATMMTAAGERPVALKILLPQHVETPESLDRFRRESSFAQRLVHPHIVSVLDFGETELGLPYIAFERLVGRSLAAVIAAEGPMPDARVAGFTKEILSALAFAHEQRIIHRDIKPANIFIASFPGRPEFVKILDFGIAAVRQGGSTQAFTAGVTVGTPAYMAPEQVAGEAIDARTDLYALGLTVAEMIIGTPVFEHEGGMMTALEQASERPVPLPPGLHRSSLARVVARATAKRPDQRYPSARDMLADIEAVGRTVSSTPLAAPWGATPPGASAPAATVSGARTPYLPPTMPSASPPAGSGPVPGVAVTAVSPGGRPKPSLRAVWLVVGGVVAGGLVATAVALYVTRDTKSASRDDEPTHKTHAKKKPPPELAPAKRFPLHPSLESFTLNGTSAREILDQCAAAGYQMFGSPVYADNGFPVVTYAIYRGNDENVGVQFMTAHDEAGAKVSVTYAAQNGIAIREGTKVVAFMPQVQTHERAVQLAKGIPFFESIDR